MAKNEQGSSTEGMTRKERRAAERAARKGGGAPRSTRSSGSKGPSMMMVSIAALVIGLVAVAALVVVSGGFGDDSVAAVSEPEVIGHADDLVVGRSLGDPDAPVVVEAFEDTQCPACGAFTDRIEPLLISEYVQDGTVFFTYKDFPFLGPESFDGAVAMRVAEELDGKFWEYHDVLFFNQDGENRGGHSTERLAAIAELVGLDRSEFLEEMEDPKYLDAVQAEVNEGRERGVNSTPTLFVNGELMSGVPAWEDLSARIEAAAEATRSTEASEAPSEVATEAPAGDPSEAPAGG